jgi:hypothetical protein
MLQDGGSVAETSTEAVDKGTGRGAAEDKVAAIFSQVHGLRFCYRFRPFVRRNWLQAVCIAGSVLLSPMSSVDQGSLQGRKGKKAEHSLADALTAPLDSPEKV